MSDNKGLAEQIVAVPVDAIVRNPYQPRELFNEEALKELADSIKRHGLQEPIVLRVHTEDPEKYQIVMGERRWRAHKILELATIPSVIRSYDDAQMQELGLVENLQREDLGPMEAARSLKLLLERCGNNITALCEKISKGMTYVQDRLMLLELPSAVQGFLDAGKINIAQAKVIHQIQGEEDRVKAAERAIKLNLSANELRGRVQHLIQSDASAESGDSGNASKSAAVTFPQLTAILIRVYEALDGFEFSTLGDANKRNTLKKQLGVVGTSIAKATEQLESTVVQ